MKLTVVVDNYNYEQYIAEAIDCALAQTWPDLEVIVVDDGSKDGSRAIIDGYGDRITALYKENGGQNSAFNYALEYVTGDVVIFCDADDRLHADIGARVMNAFGANPKISRMQWPMVRVDKEGQPLGRINPNPDAMATGDLRNHLRTIRNHAWPAQSGNAYSVRGLRKVFPIPEDFRIGTDLYLAETTPLLGPIKSFREPGSDYRVHGKNNWTASEIDLDNIRQRIAWTVRNHDNVRRIAVAEGLDWPESPLFAKDVAFISQRLTSVRLDPEHHPIAGDGRYSLTLQGIRAALAHPHHTLDHKLKRVAWILGVGLGTDKLARKFVKAFYFRG